MSSPTMPDAVVHAIASLPVLAPDARRAEAVRARCRTVMEGRRPGNGFALLESAAVGTICAAYVWQLGRLALLLSR